jgi:hypothetical protein
MRPRAPKINAPSRDCFCYWLPRYCLRDDGLPGEPDCSGLAWAAIALWGQHYVCVPGGDRAVAHLGFSRIFQWMASRTIAVRTNRAGGCRSAGSSGTNYPPSASAS